MLRAAVARNSRPRLQAAAQTHTRPTGLRIRSLDPRTGARDRYGTVTGPRQEADGGFTLVELLVVIAILGILASVAVFAIGGTTGKSKAAACKSDLATVQTASDVYFAKTGTFAATVAAMTTGVNQTLRSAPTNTSYAISISATTGLATASPLCTAIP